VIAPTVAMGDARPPVDAGAAVQDGALDEVEAVARAVKSGRLARGERKP
jgi:hypothetical protein